MMSPELQRDAEAVRAYFGSTPHTACILTFGCQQNEADSEKLRGMAEEMGYTLTAIPDGADLVVFNTCAIREHAEQKVLSYVGRLKESKKHNPDMVIGITGCMTAQDHRIDLIKGHYPYVSFTLDPASLTDFPGAVLSSLKSRRTFQKGEECPSIVEGMPVIRGESHKAWVSIMYGCNNYCSYCIVPYVRGRERSRHSHAILEEVTGLVKEGYREITLLGQNVNSYRGDVDFSGLLEKIANIPGDFLVRFMTSHPKDVPDSLIAVMAKYPHKIAPHFHLPMQSGSNAILKKMNRRYTREGYLEIVKKLRAAIPGIAITTDIIVGFPGETDEDFCDTLSVVEEVGFDMAYTFLYSPRKGTPAATMPDQIGEEVRGRRMQALLDLQDKMAAKCAAPYLGKTVPVLVDGKSKNGELYSGRTPTNKLVHFEGEPEDVGEVFMMTIDRAEPYALYGTKIKKGNYHECT